MVGSTGSKQISVKGCAVTEFCNQAITVARLAPHKYLLTTSFMIPVIHRLEENHGYLRGKVLTSRDKQEHLAESIATLSHSVGSWDNRLRQA